MRENLDRIDSSSVGTFKIRFLSDLVYGDIFVFLKRYVGDEYITFRYFRETLDDKGKTFKL